MAFLQMNYRSKALSNEVSLNIILPEGIKKTGVAGAPDGSFKTLYLLHGLNGDHTMWMRKTSIERYAEKYGIAVVMPSVYRSWYTDTAYGSNYFTFVCEELPEVFRSYFKGASDKREDNFIGGLSMGGYGALKAALTYPEKYFYAISLSGALDITRRGRECNLDEWRAIFDFCMLSPTELDGTRADLFELLKRRVREKVDLPELYLWCGSEDTLLPINERFSRELCEYGIEHTFDVSEGDHSWRFWDMHIERALDFIFKNS